MSCGIVIVFESVQSRPSLLHFNPEPSGDSLKRGQGSLDATVVTEDLLADHRYWSYQP